MTEDKFGNKGKAPEGVPPEVGFPADESPAIDNEVSRQLASLPREIAPDNDVWPGIELGMDRVKSQATANRNANKRPGAHWLRNAAIAATVTLTFAAGILTGQQWVGFEADRGTTFTAESNNGLLAAANQIYTDSLAASEIVYQAAFREYIKVGRDQVGVRGDTDEIIRKSWDDMRQTELALASALSTFPGDPFLVGKMMDLRRRQLAFLQQLAGMEQFSRSISRSNAI